MGSIEISILEEDIIGSTPGNMDKCALARALKRQFKSAFNVRVYQSEDTQCMGYLWSATVMSMKYTLSFNIPKDVCKIIEDYDKTGGMSPFTFTVPF